MAQDVLPFHDRFLAEAPDELRRFGPPGHDSVTVLPFVQWQSGPDAGYPRGMHHYWKSGYLRDLTEAAVATLLDVLPGMPSRQSGIGLQSLRGAASRFRSTPRRSRTAGGSTTC